MSLPDSSPSSDPSFERRWAEWVALGVRRESETRRTFSIALPAIAVVAAGALYLLVR